MELLRPVFESGRIDFAGQCRASSVSTLVLAAAGAAAFVAGFALQRLDVCFGAYALGVAAAYMAVLPPWPAFRRNPTAWLKRPAADAAARPRTTLVEDHTAHVHALSYSFADHYYWRLACSLGYLDACKHAWNRQPAAGIDDPALLSRSLTLVDRPAAMHRASRQGPTVASIRKAIQQGLDRPASPALSVALSSRTAHTAPDLFEQANVNFTEKRWVWVPDEKEGYIAGYVVDDSAGDSAAVVHLMTGRDVTIDLAATEKVNPPKFERAEDMADLGYLNEASVVHNLKQRYAANLIYTYSGLFLVAVNPYYNLQIYGPEFVAAYKNKKRSEAPPHIFSIADAAFHDMLHSKENQSILITGESGAGKTENTKKVIQYLTAIASDHKAAATAAAGGGTLEQQVLCANPILESFGNAQTIRNNNSSRFGKFVRIEFNMAGQIAGANIEWYLFEKPRVTNQSKLERNYHVFYQFMRGADKGIKDRLLIDRGPEGYAFTRKCRQTIQGVDDKAEFAALVQAMETTGFRSEEQLDLFRVVAAILHLGNMQFQATRNDEAVLREQVAAEKVCHVLGIPLSEFTRALLRPSIKAGRDWVTQSRTQQQVEQSVEALARSMYERMFGALVSRINAAMSRPDGKSTFIGVLDIAGFEILETNSFEQMCINYTNERLQQFFNRTMFVLEQEEYTREGIEWSFIDFGMDLQPTIDLIDRTKPIGIMSCLDEECVMPRATDKTFTEKLHGLWAGKSDKYDAPRFAMGFTIHHYASQVEYSTEGWLEKNKDPLNENVTRLLGNSTEAFVAELYADYAGSGSDEGGGGGGGGGGSGGSSAGAGSAARGRVGTTLKRGAFRTVAQRHKDQLNLLMAQLGATQPHFVRCILPNSDKRAGLVDTPLVLDQLRCNGVLEGIRITRQGFPNRVPFPEFRQRYEILAPNTIPRQVFVDSKQAASLLLGALGMDPERFRLGHTKVFFRAGVLAELEETRDVELSKIIVQFQAVARGAMSRGRFRRRIEQARAIRVIQRNARAYNQLCEWPWWRLYRTVKPLLHVTRVDEEMRKREARIAELEAAARAGAEERQQADVARRELERDKSNLEALLHSERSAALDQEEILKRTQERGVELEESLREHAARIEELEEQCAELAAASRAAEHAQAREAAEAKAADQARALEALARDHAQALQAAGQRADEYRRALEALEQDHAEATERSGATEAQLAAALEAQAQLERDAAALRQQVEESAGQSAREAELQSAHEVAMAQLRAELEAAAAAALDELRRSHAEAEGTLRSEAETLRRGLDAAVAERAAAEDGSRGVEAQLHEHAARMEDLETDNMRLVAAAEQAQQALAAAQGELAAAQGELATAQAEAAAAGQDLAAARQDLIAAQQDLIAAQQARDAAQRELADAQKAIGELRARLEEDEGLRDTIQQRVTVQTQELEELKEKYSQEAVARVQQLEEANQEAFAELDDLRAGYRDLEARTAALDAELDRERAHALELEQANGEFKERHDVLSADLQAARDAAQRLEAELAEQRQAAEALHSTHAETDRRLRSLVDEVGDGACNMRAAEQARAELGAQVEQLRARLEAEAGALAAAHEVKARLEAQHKEVQDRLHRELAAKDAQAEDARLKLLQEVQDLGARLEREAADRERADRERAEAAAELQRAQQAASSATRGRSDAENARRELGARLQAAEVDAEALRKAVEDYQVQADRHEKRANTLSDTLQARDMELAQAARKLQRSERRLEEVMAQAAYHLDARNRLDSENVELREKLDDAYRQLGRADTAPRSLGAAGSGSGSGSSPGAVRRLEAQAEERVRDLEAARQALAQSLQAAQREAEERQHELVDLDRSFGLLQDELAAARAALLAAERERDSARADLARLGERLESERELRGGHEERSSALGARVEALREALASADASARDAAAQRDAADQRAAAARADAADAAAARDDAVAARDAAEAQVRALEAQALELRSQLDDAALAAAELQHVRDGLQRELDAIGTRHRGDYDAHGRVLDELRGTYQKELESATAELDAIKRDHVALREAYIALDSTLALRSQDLDRATEDAADARKELQRVMAKLEELAPAYEAARDAAKARESELESVRHERDSAVARAAAATALHDDLRAARDKLEARLDEVQAKYIEASQGRQTAEKAALQLEDEIRSARARLAEFDDDQTTADDRVARLDAVVADAHLALDKEREANTLLTKEKNALEKQLKDLRLRIVRLETDVAASQVSGSPSLLPVPVADLSSRIESQAKAALEHQQKAKQLERQIRELQFQIGEREKAKQRADMDMQRLSGRLKRLEAHASALEATEQRLLATNIRLERELSAMRSHTASPALV
ncbi:class II myosin [Coemansia javaensis]|uniref:Class II myosin n=1 Tax=Coemansia javaensis TaxID=2761396 RepID=A0A9W8HIQ0_9FUNG|nr:class II myosin [Coemansia javaensis]